MRSSSSSSRGFCPSTAALAAVCVGLAGAATAHATITTTLTEVGYNDGYSSASPTISSEPTLASDGTDLILKEVGTYSSDIPVPSSQYTGSAYPINWTDGVLPQDPILNNMAGTMVYISGGANPDLATFSLGTGSNGTGYNITGVRVVTEWADEGRVNPDFIFNYSTDGVTYNQLQAVNYNVNPAGADYNVGDVTLSIMGLTNVQSVQFAFPNTQQNGAVGYNQLAVFGTSSSPVPEPASGALMTLCTVGGLLLLRRRVA